MKIKALSFRQPWAELVIQGMKTMDLRTWNTHYRGLLAVYASQTIEKEACQSHGLEPDQLSTGAIIGLVELVHVVPLDLDAYKEKSGLHLNARHYREPMFGWELSNPRPLQNPKPVRGRLNLFDVELDPEGAGSDESEFEKVDKISTDISTWGDAKPFELRVIPESDPNTGKNSYRLAIFQRRVEPPAGQQSLYKQDPGQMERVVKLGGTALRAVADQVLEALRENSYKATDLNAARKEPFSLEEESGVRLGLLFLAVKPISKVSRLEAISYGIRDMTSEELYYWYSKCTLKTFGGRAQKALRILLAEE